MRVLSHMYSKCSMKVRNLRKLPGNPPIGTFLPVYDLLHTHGRIAQKNHSQTYSYNFISQSWCKVKGKT